MSKTNLQAIEDLGEELLAILLLEYHNKNHLQFGTSPKRLNEQEREIVENILVAVKAEQANTGLQRTGVVCTCGTGNSVPAEAHAHNCAIFASR